MIGAIVAALIGVAVGALDFNALADPIAVERFVAPGPPFAGSAGVRVRF
jgi:hypothetical protein